MYHNKTFDKELPKKCFQMFNKEIEFNTIDYSMLFSSDFLWCGDCLRLTAGVHVFTKHLFKIALINND